MGEGSNLDVWTQDLLERLESRRGRVCVIGLGYVGLSLAVELAKAGFTVRGVDLDLERVSLLNRGESYLVDVASSALQPLVSAGRLSASTEFSEAKTADALVICVPTPLRKTKEPDISYIISALESLAAALYRQVTNQVFEVSSPRVAETAKLLENTFRSVNIALANELAFACRKIGVDPWEVIEAASTKPFGFMPFYPGPGIGGHCIPVDPLYLSWKVRLTGYEAQFIALADQVNRAMPAHVVTLVGDSLNDRGRALRGASVLVMGVTYKPDVNDVRESPALEIIEMLERKGAHVSYADPFTPQLTLDGVKLTAVEPTAETIAAADCVLILTNHSAFDYATIAKRATLVVDTRNALRTYKPTTPSIVTL